MEISLNGYMDKFLKMEEEYKLYDIKINGFNIWQLIRVQVSQYMESNVFGIIEGNKKKVNIIRKIICELYYFIFFNQYFFRHKDIIFIGHPRKIKDKGDYICKYTGDIVKECPYSYYVFEYPYNGKHFSSKIFEKNVRYLKHEHIFCKLYQVKVNMEEVKNIVNKIWGALNMEFDIVNDKILYSIEKLVIRIIKSLDWKEKYYRYLVRTIRPKVVVLADEYSNDNPFIIMAAKELNIPTVALQHGSIEKAHVAYNFLRKESEQLEVFPDYFFVWGNYYGINSRYPISNKRVIATGFAYLERKVREYKLERLENRKKTILFISGTPELGMIANELTKQLAPSNYEIIYRLHPREFHNWIKEYSFFDNNNCLKVIDNNDVEFLQLIFNSDFVVCTGSTGAAESIALEKKTIIMQIADYEYNMHWVNENMALGVTSLDELLAVINEEQPLLSNNKNFYFRENAINNFYEEITKIIEG